MGLVANGIEARGIPTLVVGTARDIMEQARAPRAVFVDYPVGRTFGRPNEDIQHQMVLTAALLQLSEFSEYGQIRDLDFQWAGEDRSWEQMVRDELLSFRRVSPDR